MFISRTRETISPYAVTILRIVIGLIFVFTGLGKIQNPAGFIAFVTRLGFPIPEIIGWLPIILEPIGGALLVLGIGTRWLSAYFVLEMLVTTFIVKAARGTPFIQAGGTAGVGWELDLLLFAGALVLAMMGSTHISVERTILKREL